MLGHELIEGAVKWIVDEHSLWDQQVFLTSVQKVVSRWKATTYCSLFHKAGQV